MSYLHDYSNESLEKKGASGQVFSSFQLNSKDIFSRKSKENEDFEIIDNSDILLPKSHKSEVFEKKINLLKTSIILQKPENKNYSNLWTSFTTKISDYTNKMKYNIITTNSYVNFRYLENVKIFDQIFSQEDIRNQKLSGYFAKVFQMTYRSNFEKIIAEDKIYTSDCGWGCMIRAAQMMLAKAIIEIKIYKLNHILDEDLFKKIKIETVLLFFDNNLKIDDILNNPDFKILLKNYAKIVDEEEKKFYKRKSISSCHSDNIMKNFEYINNDVKTFEYVSEVTPPFSIQNICKLGTVFDKRPGTWFSNITMCNIFEELNSQFEAIPQTEIFHFNEGVINETEILKKCFENIKCDELKCKNLCNFEEQELSELISKKLNLQNNSEEKASNFTKICEDCFKNSKISNTEYLLYDDHLFKFKKSGIILVSVRLGLDNIHSEYIYSIESVFDIKNNLGIIGGRKNSALYFIGNYDGNLLYLDPHINQKAFLTKKELEQSFEESYSAKYIYKIDIKNISPAFTVGFYFRDINEYKELVENFKEHSAFKFPVFKFKKFSQEKEKETEETVQVTEDIDEDDDFCVINFKKDI